MATSLYIYVLIIHHVLTFAQIDALECYKCDRLPPNSSCNTTVTCDQNMMCYTGMYREDANEFLRYDCVQAQNCQLDANGIGLVGKRKTTTQICKACCHDNLCNKNGCIINTDLVQTTTNVTPDCKDFASECKIPAFLNAVCPSEPTARQFCPKSCNLCKVRVDGGWSDWTTWSPCPVTCGRGSRQRNRTCSNPAPEHGGKPCVGDVNEVTTCNLSDCPVDGHWSDWSAWTTCNVTCGRGGQNRVRTCSNPLPQHGGKVCDEPTNFIQHQDCDTSPCPVDGQWSDWTAWSRCHVTCGQGTHSRVRTCSNPKPKFGGKDCENSSSFVEVQNCSSKPCPIDGQWSDWSSWGTCDVTCGGGTQIRARTCSNPLAQFGGKPCENSTQAFVQRQTCNEQKCPVDGQWSDWSAWGSCNVTCGGGSKSRARTCSNPSPSQTGKPCKNPSSNIEITDCNTMLCPVDGHWTSWTSWSVCNATCGSGGGGIKTRIRSCSNPAPDHGGKPCENSNHFIETEQCHVDSCIVDGHWSDWSSWYSCNVTCGGGTEFRVRTCSNPVPKNGGQPCENPATYHEFRPCNLQSCPANSGSTALPVTTPHLEPAKGCQDSYFCADSHIKPLACLDSYIATTYCPKLCGICGTNVTPGPCIDINGANCQDPIYLRFTCSDKDLAHLCAKACSLCH